MSELKPYIGPHPTNHTLTEYYPKPEADAAIDKLKAEHHKERHEYIKMVAELKAQKAQAEDDCVFWKKKYNDCRRELDLLKDTNAFYNGGK